MSDQSQSGTVGKALVLLDVVASYGRPVKFTELLGVTPHPKATLHRLLQTLLSQNMLSHNSESQTYHLGLRLVRLAHAAWRQSSLAPIARKAVDELSLRVRATVHLAQLDHGQVLYVDKRNAASPIPMFSDAGKIGPAYCTGVGKAILAFLETDKQERVLAQQSYHRYTPNTLASADMLKAELGTIAASGIAFDREEHEPGIICIAAPILSSAGKPFGALSITSSTRLDSLETLAEFTKDLIATARAIGSEAEIWRFPETTTKN